MSGNLISAELKLAGRLDARFFALLQACRTRARSTRPRAPQACQLQGRLDAAGNGLQPGQ
jgi:hypothetical protein